MALYIPHSIFPFEAAFVCQAGNFWTLLRSIKWAGKMTTNGKQSSWLPYIMWLYYRTFEHSPGQESIQDPNRPSYIGKLSLCMLWTHTGECTYSSINPLNAELNPIRHLLALVGARHFVHVSWIRVSSYSSQCIQNEWVSFMPKRRYQLNGPHSRYGHFSEDTISTPPDIKPRYVACPASSPLTDWSTTGTWERWRGKLVKRPRNAHAPSSVFYAFHGRLKWRKERMCCRVHVLKEM